MKIKKVEVKNFKAVDEQSMDFNGCSAIVTAGNDKGKTSILRGLIDRFKGEKPDVILKEGTEKGFNIMELTDGSRIEWKFTDKTESFAYITKEGVKQTSAVLSSIGEKYFGVKFDIDKFLVSQPKVQAAEVQKLVGLDFTDVDVRHKTAYDHRTECNRAVKDALAKKLEKPVEVSKPDVEGITKEKEEAKAENKKLKDQWEKDNKKHKEEIDKFNIQKQQIEDNYDQAKSNLEAIEFIKDSFLSEAVDYEKALKLFEDIPKPQEEKEKTDLPEPEYKDIDAIDKRLEEANADLLKYQTYERDLKEYNQWIDDGKKARKEQQKAQEAVEKIEKEKQEMIANAEIPKDFEITEDGILYKGLPLTNNQISSSAKYIAALKLGSMVLGEVKTLHFDASFLDKNSLSEVQKWADDNELQLLIERPDWDDGEIKYEILES
jgi:hypothetical protein